MDLTTILIGIALIPVILFVSLILFMIVVNILVYIYQLIEALLPIVVGFFVIVVPMIVAYQYTAPNIGGWAIPVAIGVGIWSGLIAFGLLYLLYQGGKWVIKQFSRQPTYNAPNNSHHYDYSYKTYYETHGTHLRPYDQLSPKEQEERREMANRAFNSQDMKPTMDRINDFVKNFDINDYKK